MKKVFNKISFASLMLVASAMPAMAEDSNKALCDLVDKMSHVFGLLRTLAFIGAAFIVAGWAWGFITAGDAKLDDVKKKGIGLIVGFTLLFAVGLVLTFVMSEAGTNAMGCDFKNFGNR